MTAPAPGTKEIEEVQPNWDLLFYFLCEPRTSGSASFGGALSAAYLRCLSP